MFPTDRFTDLQLYSSGEGCFRRTHESFAGGWLGLSFGLILWSCVRQWRGKIRICRTLNSRFFSLLQGCRFSHFFWAVL